MSLPLPQEGTAAREALDIQYLVDITTSKDYPTLAESRASVKNTFVNSKGIKKVNTITLMADGSLKLLSWGSRLGRKVLFNFGKV